ncbi:hypothetical protein [Bythopirellula goksoeyrii]|nr:hypothetical protein [Bythopirellula goksoeyrii]
MLGGKTKALVLLCAGIAGFFTCFDAYAQLRMVTYNTLTGQAFGGQQTARLPYSSTILEAIGLENVGGISKPIDVLILQEQFSMELSTQSFVDVLNSIYGAGTYARSTINGAVSSFNGGGGRPGLVYNTQSVQLIDELAFGTVGTGDLQPRASLRYQLRPVGYDASADFYVYNNHYRSDNPTSRLIEATSVRNNSDALGEGIHAIYAGDYNVTSSNVGMFQELLSSGNGQAFDPIDTLGVWHDNQFIGPTDIRHVHTQSPAVDGDPIDAEGGADGGLDDRFDFQLVTGEFLDDEGLSYIPGSYRAFGNNGTHNLNDRITSGTGASPTVLSALLNNSDHLPVVADYQLPAKMNAMLASVPTNVMQGASVGIDVFVENIANVLSVNGADELDYTITVGGSLLGSGSGTAFPLAGADMSQIFLDTSSTGFKTGIVTVASSSQQAANPVFNFPVSFTVGGGSGGEVFGVIAKDTFDESLKLNSFSQDPAVGAYSSNGDGFQQYQVGVSSSIPSQLVDDSLNGNPVDVQGMIDTSTKTDAWFGITDTVNGDNLPVSNPGEVTATWEFDVAGAFDMQVSIDMAAMGDFEASGVNGDRFNWTYQIDNGSVLPLFSSTITEDISQTYALADGDMFTLDDPVQMTTTDSEIVTLSNLLQTLTSPIDGLGDLLTIQLTAKTDGGDEAYAFDNLIIEGTTFVEFLAADFNQDGNVDDIDLTKWQMDYALGNGSDADADGDTDGADFLVWQRQYGQSTLPLLASTAAVPEPSGFLLLTLAALVSGSLTRPTR